MVEQWKRQEDARRGYELLGELADLMAEVEDIAVALRRYHRPLGCGGAEAKLPSRSVFRGLAMRSDAAQSKGARMQKRLDGLRQRPPELMRIAGLMFGPNAAQPGRPGRLTELRNAVGDLALLARAAG